MTDDPKTMTVEQADYKARLFVNGWTRNPKTSKIEPRSGDWAEVFLSHPLVRQSTKNGWDNVLRTHVIARARTLILEGRNHRDIEALMPTDMRWIDYHDKQGLAYLDAKAWRAANLNTGFWEKRHTKGAGAPSDDSQDRRRPMSVGEAVTRAAQAGFPHHVETDQSN